METQGKPAAQPVDLYANGFSATLGNTDVLLVLHVNGKPAYNLNMSYTFAKTLSQKLGHVVSLLEQYTGNNIMLSDEIAEQLKIQVKPKPAG